ncbi:ATP-dependent RNA helicase [Musa troglodytarum]|uniref:RNA helicase n=1 Tax=Musa troglodytarum TaxID=320322 RepID=A0A9E7I196_9LILI|nr:ATP-dependent RNA helicase [Musa troglodytarum]
MILTPPYKDLVAQAHNGSGKTTCFVIGMLSRVDPKRKIPQAICICPTRELAQQHLESQVVTIQMDDAESCGPSEDGKDGFRDDSERIMKEIQRSSGGCQVLLFSATFDEAVKAFVSRCTRNSARMLHQSLTEEGYECTSVQGALKQEDRDQIIKEFKDGLTKVLITTDLLARDFDQRQFFEFNNSYAFLVLLTVNLVINYDLPIKHDNPSEPDCELYLHRVGRTGALVARKDKRLGAVFNFLCTARDRSVMEKIERHFRHHIPEEILFDS